MSIWSRCRLFLVLVALALAGGSPFGARAGDADDKLLQALRAMDKGDWQWAKRTVDSLGSRPLSLYARWRELLEGDPKPSFAAYADFLTHHADWPSLGTLQARAEEQIDEDVDYKDRLAFFARLTPKTRQGRIRYAQALLSAGRTAEAVTVLRQSWVVDDFPLSEERYFLGLYRDYLRPQDHAARLDRLLWDGEIVSAQRLLPFVPSDLDRLATARIRLQGLERTAEAAVAAVPRALQANAGLLFDEVRFYRRRNRDTQADTLLTHPPANLVRGELWWAEQSRAIRDHVEDGGFDRAYQIAQAHRQTEGPAFADGEWLAGWIALRFLNQPAVARRHFERLWQGVATPISRGRAAYWAGRAAEAAGQRGAAREWFDRGARFPTTFYGQLAARKVGVDLAALLPARMRASPAAREQLRRREAAAVGRTLCELDDSSLAQPFFRHLGVTAARSPDALRAVVELGEECTRSDLMIVAAKAAAKEGADVEAYAAFPAPPIRTLRAGDDALPEPPLRLAVARQESQFDPRVSSPAGALGLMQLLPSTAEAMCDKLGMPYSRSRLMRDAEYNARLGSFYLGRQLDRYDQAAALALAAYNAGPSRVDEWLETHGDPRGQPVEKLVDWIERIPFSETRNYVQRVLEAREIYAVLLRRDKGSVRQADADPAPKRPG